MHLVAPTFIFLFYINYAISMRIMHEFCKQRPIFKRAKKQLPVYRMQQVRKEKQQKWNY
jgi:hypothetical protein